MFTDARISIAYRAGAHLSARQLRVKQSYTVHFVDRPFTMTGLSKIRRAEMGADEKTFVMPALHILIYSNT